MSPNYTLNSIVKTQKTNEIWAKDLDRHFTKDATQVEKFMEGCSEAHPKGITT
jgi:hypothetical protein